MVAREHVERALEPVNVAAAAVVGEAHQLVPRAKTNSWPVLPNGTSPLYSLPSASEIAARGVPGATTITRSQSNVRQPREVDVVAALSASWIARVSSSRGRCRRRRGPPRG